MDGDAALLRTLKRARPKSVWLAATMPRTGSDARRLAECRRLAAAVGVPLLPTNDALDAPAAPSGRASGRGRACTAVFVTVHPVTVKKKQKEKKQETNKGT